ncbi:hypothetical protein GF380_03300 [Candidatus Uhrbacteria bacterium]|nr:hypothetical protein [Candidatus Uhrbacteria bacterium]MBD3284161.1 hypothetical protein [Candidatus Uhrbacteria bacterium]
MEILNSLRTFHAYIADPDNDCTGLQSAWFDFILALGELAHESCEVEQTRLLLELQQLAHRFFEACRKTTASKYLPDQLKKIELAIYYRSDILELASQLHAQLQQRPQPRPSGWF